MTPQPPKKPQNLFKQTLQAAFKQAFGKTLQYFWMPIVSSGSVLVLLGCALPVQAQIPTQKPAQNSAQNPAPTPVQILAQLTPDETLSGAERSNLVDQGNNQILIDGGARRGSNLFHSFLDFNVEDGQWVYFATHSDTANVLSRVTGNNPSNIFGTLGVQGDANLWLINPNGIVLGENASLDMSGAFYGVAASAVPLGGSVFSATSPQSSRLLSVAPDVSFTNFLADSSGDVILQGAFESPTDMTLAGRSIQASGRLGASGHDIRLLAAGDITTNGLDSSVSANNGNAASGGEIEAVTYAGGNILNQGVVDSRSVTRQGNAGAGGAITLETRQGGDITNQGLLRSRSAANTIGNANNGGDITIVTRQGGNIVNEGVRSQSIARVGNAGRGGDITMRAENGGNITNRQAVRSLSSLRVDLMTAGNAARGGNITLSTSNGSIFNADDLVAQSSTPNGDTGRGGAITISAAGNIENQGSLTSFSRSQVGQAEDGGAISLTSTAGGSIVNRGRLQSFSISNRGDAGNGGSIVVSATEGGSITHQGALNAQSLANDIGDASDGGSITITTDEGDIINRPLFSSNSENDPNSENGGSFNTRSVSRRGLARNAGNIRLVTTGGEIFLNAYLDAKSYSLRGDARNGGDVLISTETGSIRGDTLAAGRTNIITSAVSSLTPAQARTQDAAANPNEDRGRVGGSVTLRAGQTISGFSLFTLSNLGQSGDVTFQSVGDLSIEDTQIITNEDVVSGDFRFDVNPIFPSNPQGDLSSDEPITINTPRSGQPGNVFISSLSGSLRAVNLFVSSDANSPVAAGNITLSSPGVIQLTDSRLATDSVNTGAGGNINIENANVVVLDNTDLVTNTVGAGTAGNISVEAADYLLLINGSSLLADAGENENGGNITVRSPQIIANPNGNNDIIANANRGNGGTVNLSGATVYGFSLQQDLTTSRLRNTRTNDISASSEFGEDGSVSLNALTDTPIETDLDDLEGDFSTPDQLISNSCISPDTATAGSFTIPGSGDLPTMPEDSMASRYSLGDVQTLPYDDLSASSDNPDTAAQADEKRDWEPGDPVVEPESVTRLADGRVVFGQHTGQPCDAS